MRPAIVILGQGSLATARRIAQVYPGAVIHGLLGRVDGADQSYREFGATLRQLYQQGTPLIALCAAGIVIRITRRAGRGRRRQCGGAVTRWPGRGE